MREDENTQAPQPDDAYHEQHQTQDFPAYEPPPPVAQHPGPPQWATAPVVARPRVREAAVLGVSIGMSLALVLGLPAAVVAWTPVGEWIGITQPDNATAAIAQAGQAGADAAEQAVDLREAAVFLHSNDAKGNEIVAFSRAQDGKLTEVGRFATGGLGSGTAEDNSNALVLGTAEGEASPIQNVDKAEFLFVPNGGDNTVSVMKINADGLELVSRVPSGGEKPVSLAVNRGLLYVLNSGEFDDRLILGPAEGLENCTTGHLPSVTGFKVSQDGQLSQIPGSTRLLTGEQNSGCAQVGFTPDGRTLVVTERIAGDATGEGGWAKGAIVTFPVRQDGTLGAAIVNIPTGNGPYSFSFAEDGTMVTTEQNGAFLNFQGGYAANYRVNPDSSLTPVGGSVANQGTDPCWIVISDQQVAFVASPFGGGQIGSYSINQDGTLTLLHAAATAADGRDHVNDGVPDGIFDLGLSRDSRYLYQLNGLDGGLYVFQVNANATLTLIEKHEVFNLRPFGMGGEGGPAGIATF